MAKNLISIPENANDWKNSIKEYEANKKTLEWGSNPRQPAITNKVVKERDNIFNPILQVYNNKEHEHHLRKQEHQDLVKALAQNKDRSLRYEQTFDLITLKDKLKGFENHPDYPKENTSDHSKKVESTKAKYNIISNKNFKEHHYLMPEKRPEVPEVEKSRATKINAVNYRDYDVISNKYKEFDVEKVKADFEIQKLTAAKNYWKTHNYDPILVKYIDDEKEKDYQRSKKDKEKDWGKEQQSRLPPTIKGDGLLYNPINMHIVDEKGLKNADLKKKNKKKRFELRYDMENFYRNRDFVRDDAFRENSENKYSYKRFKEIDQRGFDILTNNPSADEYKNKTKLKDKNNNWEKLINFAGDNKTILNKEIYKDPYDHTDNKLKSKAFINNRKEFLKQLPSMDKDNNFANPYKANSIHESNLRLIDNNNYKNMNENNVIKVNKEDWFKDKRDNVVKPTLEFGGMNCLQKSLSASNNRKNNLYNMKHLLNA